MRVSRVSLRIDPISCDGRGVCAELLPELVRLDDWGYPITDEARVPPDLLDAVRLAAELCPKLALHLEADLEE